jgi:hypothetical protein
MSKRARARTGFQALMSAVVARRCLSVAIAGVRNSCRVAVVAARALAPWVMSLQISREERV